MIRAFFKWLFTDPDKARASRHAPKPQPEKSIYSDPDPYGEDYGCNSIFGMG